ncbi:membrane protein [Streptomyces sp. 2224.1]|uniref:YihY/virulence factor BrkB family protein n=1 Tax=unclassified Streptomyces TaxID=2593676 RepID=UPI00089086A9|nr:membrane protein [Streptomyces sp. 2321.6]SDQ95045.1 membrane protein [Streptomyces sp. KS_16]SED79663.1 membrane protein [Streptomyces sp. 2112.3]SED89459.1 membrane protein [Streptomyces sp. 2133.1]SED99866.1 membrane protein [Streptomyces sp. 2224.1]SNC73020.1 membrane protein [Streptomyces sp. 2114.4]
MAGSGMRRGLDRTQLDRALGAAGPRQPAALPTWAQFRTALRRTPLSVWHDDVTDWAASLTYYSVLALLPTLIVTVSLIGLADPAATEQLINQITSIAPAQSGPTVHRALVGMAHQRTAAWVVLGGALISALWSSCSYLAVFRRALHAMNRTKDDRPPWRKAPRILMTALLLMALLISSAVALLVSGPIATALGRAIGLGEAGEATWNLLKWPLLLLLATVLAMVLFRSGPPSSRGVRRAVPGGVVAVLLWLVSSAGFAAYTSYVGTFNRLYGSLAGPVVFLIWLWFSHLSLLSGAQFNVELARAGRVVRPRAGS